MPFTDYKKNPWLLPYTLPIIPLDAELGQNSKIIPKNLGKIPGTYDEKQKCWFGFGEFTKHLTKAKELDVWAEGWKRSGTKQCHTIGLRADWTPALDVDTENYGVICLVEDLMTMMFMASEIRRTRSNSRRVLIPYRLAEDSMPVPKMRLAFKLPDDPTLHAIEFCGRGNQYLIEGWHKSGVAYEWQGKPLVQCKPEEIPEVCLDQVKAFFNALKGRLEAEYGATFPTPGTVGGNSQTTAGRSKIGDDHPDRCPDLPLLARWLEANRNDSGQFDDRDDWIKALMAIKAASGGDEDFYYDHVEPWCLQYDQEADYVREKWESIHDSALGWSYLVAIGQANSPELLGAMFARADGSDPDWSGLESGDVGEPPKPVTDRKLPDERTIAHEFVQREAKKRWLAVMNDTSRDATWYRAVDGIWEPDNLTILHEASNYCAAVAEFIRKQIAAGAYGSATEISKAHARAQALMGIALARNVAGLARSHPDMVVKIDELDKADWLLAYPGGYIDKNNDFHKPDASLLFTKRLLVKPDLDANPEKRCPKFMAHLNWMFDGDADKVEAALRWFGYCLSGTGQEQKFYFWRGEGGTGITTLLEIIGAVAGSYGKPIKHQVFTTGSGGERFGTATLAGAYFCYSNEIDKACQWSDATLKQATGGGHMEIEEKHRDQRPMRLRCGINFQGNNVPAFGHVDQALRRRMVLIEFTKTRESEGLPDIKGFARMVASEEGAAILGALLAARKRYWEKGCDLMVHADWKSSTDAYFASIDTKGIFLTDEVEFDQEGEMLTKEWYDAFVDWHRDMGYGSRPPSFGAFMRDMKSRPEMRQHHVVFTRKWLPDGSHPHIVIGIKLRKRVDQEARLRDF